jgi:hypothetical protein
VTRVRTLAGLTVIGGVMLATTACLGHGGGAAAGTQGVQTASRVIGHPTSVPVAAIAAATPRQLLDAASAQVGNAGHHGIRITRPPVHFTAGRAWMAITLPSGQRQAAFRQWAALMAAVVYRDQAPGDGLLPVAGTSVNELHSSVLAGGPRAHHAHRTFSAESLRCLSHRHAARIGARVVSLRLLHVEGLPVPVVTISIPDALARRSGGNTGLAGSVIDSPDSDYLGYFVTVVDGEGRWVQTGGLVPSSGSGVGGVSPRYQAGQACGGPIECVLHG